MTDQASRHVAALIEVERWNEAAAAASTALANDPDNRDLLGSLAHAQLGLGSTRDALATANRFVQTHPEDPWGHRIAAVALMHLKDPDAAAAARQVVRLAPHSWSGYHILAVALARSKKDRREARAAAARAVELAPNEPSAHFAVGFVEHQAGNPRAARASYAKVLELDPTHYEAQNNLGVLGGLNLGRSIGSFLGALRSNPDGELAQRNLHRMMTRLTLNLLIGAAATWALASLLGDIYHGPSLASRVLGVVFIPIAIVYVVSVVRRVPVAAWRHTTRRFGIPVRALWGLLPVALISVWTIEACFSGSVH